MGTVRAELALRAGEPRRGAGRGRARGGGGGAGARHRPPAGPLHRRAVRRRAAARRARRGAGRAAAAGGARRADLAARPGRRRRADRRCCGALNEDCDTAIVLAEHRLERCLGAADRVDRAAPAGAIVCDAAPREFLAWAGDAAPELQTPGARLLVRPRAGRRRRASSAARAALRSARPAPGRRRGSRRRRRRTRRDRRRRRRRARRARAARSTASGTSCDAGRRSCAASRSTSRRASGCADGPQRRGQVDAAAPRRRADGAHPRQGRAARAGSRCCCRTPPTTWCTRRVAPRRRPAALAAVGLGGPRFADRHPRDLSGGEKQRLALAIVLGDRSGEPPGGGVPGRADARHGPRPQGRAGRAAARACDAAVIVATHDPEFAAAFAQTGGAAGRRRPDRRRHAPEVLAGGRYFATETARILGGAGGALTARARASRCVGTASRRAPGGDRVSWQLGAFALLAVALAGGFAWYERDPSRRADRGAGRARWRRSPRWAGSPSPPCPTSSRRPTSC